MTPSGRSDIAAMGKAWSSSIWAAIGPEERRRAARDRYIRGDIDVAELELELERINRQEMGDVAAG